MTCTIHATEDGTGAKVAVAASSTGIIEHAALGTGGGGSTKFLREDSTWQAVAGGSPAFAVGGIYINVTGTNPATELGYGTWSAFAAGRVMVGFDSGDTDFDTVEETGGAKTVASAGSNAAEAAHTHSVTSNVTVGDEAAHTHTYTEVVNHTHTRSPIQVTVTAWPRVRRTVLVRSWTARMRPRPPRRPPTPQPLGSQPPTLSAVSPRGPRLLVLATRTRRRITP